MRDHVPYVDQLLEEADRLGLRHQELARRAGIKPETLSRLRQRKTCDFATILQLARVLGKTLELVNDRPHAARVARGFDFPGEGG